MGPRCLPQDGTQSVSDDQASRCIGCGIQLPAGHLLSLFSRAGGCLPTPPIELSPATDPCREGGRAAGFHHLRSRVGSRFLCLLLPLPARWGRPLRAAGAGSSASRPGCPAAGIPGCPRASARLLTLRPPGRCRGRGAPCLVLSGAAPCAGKARATASLVWGDAPHSAAQRRGAASRVCESHAAVCFNAFCVSRV